jgi:hypothetical protein
MLEPKIPYLTKASIKCKGKSRAPVAHTCNATYSGGRDQEDCGSKPARQIVQETLSQK